MKINEYKTNLFTYQGSMQKNGNSYKIVGQQLPKNQKAHYKTANSVIEIFKGKLITKDLLESKIYFSHF